MTNGKTWPVKKIIVWSIALGVLILVAIWLAKRDWTGKKSGSPAQETAQRTPATSGKDMFPPGFIPSGSGVAGTATQVVSAPSCTLASASEAKLLDKIEKLETKIATQCMGKTETVYEDRKPAPAKVAKRRQVTHVAKATPAPVARTEPPPQPVAKVVVPNRVWAFVQHDATASVPKACYFTRQVNGTAPRCSAYEVEPARANESESEWTARIARDFIGMKGYRTEHLGKM